MDYGKVGYKNYGSIKSDKPYGERKNNTGYNGQQKKSYNNPNKAKRFDDKRRMDKRKPNKPKGPAPICPEELFVTNSYGMAISYVPAANVPEAFKGIKKMNQNDNFPFYVFDRMTMKSTINVINSIVHLIEYSFGNAWEDVTGSVRNYEGAEAKTILESFRGFKIVDASVNWGTIGVTPEVKTEDETIRCLDKDGNMFTWYRNKSKKPELKATNEFAILEKDVLEDFAKDIMNELIAKGSTFHKCWESYDTRDKAALFYPWYTINVHSEMDGPSD